MKSSPVRPVLLAGIIILSGIGAKIYLDSKSGNESEKALTQKTSEVLSEKSKTLKEVIAQNQKKQEEMSNSPIPLPPGATMLTRERIYTEEEITSMTEEEFKTMLNDTERRLPSKKDIKDLPPGALHHTPGIIVEAGRNLGAIKEVLKAHENYEKIALPFYEKCSMNNEGTTTVRALCLTNLVLIKEKNGEKVNTNSYPQDIVKLSKLVTDL